MIDTRQLHDDASFSHDDESDVDTRCITWSFALYLVYLTAAVFEGEYGTFKTIEIIGVLTLDVKFILAVVTISKPSILEESKAPAKMMGVIYLICYPLQIYWMTETLEYCTAEDSPCSEFKLEVTTLFIVHLVDVFLIFWFVLREVLFCFFGICAPDNVTGEVAHPLLRDWQGMSPSEVDAMEVHVLQPNQRLQYENLCVICLEDIEEGTEYRILPCKHSFHRECIDEWLSLNAICPHCKNPLKEQEPLTLRAEQASSLYYGAILR